MSKIQQPKGLISVLLNTKAEFGDRDDAAMDLGAYDDPEAELSLLKIASYENDDPHLLDRCGESLGEIWCRKGQVNHEALKRLKGRALESALGMIKSRHPELLGKEAS